MRTVAVLVSLLALGACSSSGSGSSDSARLTLNNPYWEKVNVQLVLTRSSNCDSRGDGFIEIKDITMAKNRLEVIQVPDGANVCWRRDRNPNDPVVGAWSGWTKATLFPGRNAEADL
jgi:hypothetical protein